MGKVLSTLLTVVIAVGASAAVWIAANLLFNQVRYRWVRFSALAFGAIGAIVGILLSGNRVTRGSEGGFLQWVWLPVVLGVAFGAIGVAMARTDDPARRQAIGVASGAVIGVGLALLVQDRVLPALDWAAIGIYTAVGLAVGAGLGALRKHPPLNGAALGGALGWLVGAWGGADLGDGSTVEAIIATAVPTVVLGWRIGRSHNPDLTARAEIDRRSRAVIFLAPALLFIFATLVVPTIRTMYLSLLDRNSESFVGLENYVETFQEPATWDAGGFGNFFTSRLFYLGVILLVIALITGVTMKKRTGRAVELGSPTAPPLIVGLLLLAFALFTALRGTIVNNLWWVVTVTLLATGLGLAVAVLADGKRGEKVAKSVIFMPMAISLVGAAIIWRFMYTSREVSQDQTGVLNALWVGLGRLSTGSGIPTFIVGALAAVALLGLGVLIARALVTRNWSKAVVPGVGFLLVGWFFFRYVGSGVGGVGTNAAGETVPQTIGFLQEGPYNNFWLMVILIWIQTGFAMVILSAAIKAVPDELIEAARVDGATPSQIFWRVTLPQIATTIGVVVTTLIVLVMKVFDIVKVTTNGQFGTQVLANDMYTQAFNNFNVGRGAALAVILFLSVLPVMYFNIRRMQED